MKWLRIPLRGKLDDFLLGDDVLAGRPSFASLEIFKVAAMHGGYGSVRILPASGHTLWKSAGFNVSRRSTAALRAVSAMRAS